MKDLSPSALRRRRLALVRRMPPVERILRGSLIERYKRCGKPGCRCAQGPGHGPKHYLSVSQAGTLPRMDYVLQEQRAQVEAYLANYRLVRELLKEIGEINRELLCRRERL